MSYIVDNFPTWDAAEQFADDAADELQLSVIVFADSEAAHRHDPFINVQRKYIAHVHRPWPMVGEKVHEQILIRLAAKHGGEYVGT